MAQRASQNLPSDSNREIASFGDGIWFWFVHYCVLKSWQIYVPPYCFVVVCQALCTQFGYYDGHKLSWYLQNFLQHCQIIEICHYILLTITLQLTHPWPWIKNFSFSQRNSTTFLRFVPLPKSNMCCLQWTFCRSWFIHKKAFSM